MYNFIKSYTSNLIDKKVVIRDWKINQGGVPVLIKLEENSMTNTSCKDYCYNLDCWQ